LSQELAASGHPFCKLIEGLTFLLENKYKKWVENVVEEKGVVEIDDFSEALSKDVGMAETFFKLVAKPLVELFSAACKEERFKVDEEISNFMVTFLRTNIKFCTSLRKIVRFAVKKSREMELY
jgi:hypothetical protein